MISSNDAEKRNKKHSDVGFSFYIVQFSTFAISTQHPHPHTHDKHLCINYACVFVGISFFCVRRTFITTKILDRKKAIEMVEKVVCKSFAGIHIIQLGKMISINLR